MITQDEVYSKVTDCLVQALGVDEDEVTPDASLTNDLGAESIDFLDIVFRLEKSFGIKIPRGGLFPEHIFSNPKFVKDGLVTESGLNELRESVPHLDITQFSENPNVNNFGDVFTVNTLVKFVNTKLT